MDDIGVIILNDFWNTLCSDPLKINDYKKASIASELMFLCAVFSHNIVLKKIDNKKNWFLLKFDTQRILYRSLNSFWINKIGFNVKNQNFINQIFDNRLDVYYENILDNAKLIRIFKNICQDNINNFIYSNLFVIYENKEYNKYLLNSELYCKLFKKAKSVSELFAFYLLKNFEILNKEDL